MPNSNYENSRKQKPIRQQNQSKKTLIKINGRLPNNAKRGTIYAVIGKVCIVLPEGEANFIECFIGGTLITQYKDASLAAVGDEVDFQVEEYNDSYSGLQTGTILKINKRGSKISRKAAVKSYKEHVIATNSDQLLILGSFTTPDYNKKLIDRFYISSIYGGLKPAICINKMDLCPEHEIVEEDLEIYTELEVPIFFISVEQNEGLEEIKKFLKDKRTVFAGQSGVGKSSLVNYLLGNKVQAINEISERTGKGQHTTSFNKMFDLPFGGQIIDTPGIREFGIWGIEQHELALYFDDFDEFSEHCKYQPCSHIHEPGCRVAEAAEEGIIDPERYISYVNIYESIEERPY